MFRLLRNKRIVGLGLILVGLSIILLLPKLSEASQQTPLYTIDMTSVEFYCNNCLPIQEQSDRVPVAIQYLPSPPTDSCDICHPEVIEHLDDNVARANQLEASLRQTSTTAIVLQGVGYSDLHAQRITQAIHILAIAQAELSDGNLDTTEDLLNQANNLLADVEDEETLQGVWSAKIGPVAILNLTPSKNKYKRASQLNHLASYLFGNNTSSSPLFSLDNSVGITYNPSAMHRRAPPADEDALIITTAYLFGHERLSLFSAQSLFYCQSSAMVNRSHLHNRL